MPEPRFFGREEQMRRLDLSLATALSGCGSIALVVGEAGSGKTALVEAFMSGARERHQDLAFAKGDCSALGGLGDPYLPFREILIALTAANAGEGTFATPAQTRLGRFFSRSAEILVEIGPDLIGTIIPGGGLAAAVGQAVADKTGLLDEVMRLGRKGAVSGDAIEPGRIHEQYANVLKTLAAERPIVLVVDDLHWADESSIGLLFHLFRRVQNARILIVGTFRPDEVGQARQEDRHPLEKAVAEIKRYAGDVTIDLAEVSEAERRDFVNRMIDSEPNALDHAFRQQFFDHTGGHPLFAVELLRALTEGGQLLRDENDRWQAGELDWAALPARVEGVIEARLGRLDEEEREILDVACVEGLTFSAEVVSRAANLPLGPLVRTLSRRLDRQHRLVREREGETKLSGYAFSHALIQRYLYGELGRAERRVLHGEIARAQEHLLGDDAAAGPHLAWHFDMAGEADAAARHYLAAGERAAQQGAPREALTSLDRALRLLPQDDRDGRWRALTAKAGVLEVLSEIAARRETIEDLSGLARAGGDAGRLAEALRFRADHLAATGDHQKALEDLDQMISAAAMAGRDDLRAVGLGMRAFSLNRLGEVEAAMEAMEEALTVADLSASAVARVRVLRSASLFFAETGDTSRSLRHARLGIELAQRIEDPVSEARLHDNLGIGCIHLGLYDEAEQALRTSLVKCRRLGYRRVTGYSLQNLALATLHRGDVDGAKTLAGESLDELGETDDTYGQGGSHLYLGYIHEAAGRIDAAAAAFAEAQVAFAKVGAYGLAIEALAGRARCDLALGRLEGAALRTREVWGYLEAHGGAGLDNRARAFVTCADVFVALGMPDAAQTAIEAGHRELTARVAQISDAVMRRSFLEQVPDNHILWQRGQGLA